MKKNNTHLLKNCKNCNFEEIVRISHNKIQYEAPVMMQSQLTAETSYRIGFNPHKNAIFGN